MPSSSPRRSSSYTGDPDAFQRSLAITVGIFAVVGLALYLFLFVTSRETVQRDVAHVSGKQSVATLKGNKPLIMLCVASLAFLTALFSLQTVNVYYARDVLGNANLPHAPDDRSAPRRSSSSRR